MTIDSMTMATRVVGARGWLLDFKLGEWPSIEMTELPCEANGGRETACTGKVCGLQSYRRYRDDELHEEAGVAVWYPEPRGEVAVDIDLRTGRVKGFPDLRVPPAELERLRRLFDEHKPLPPAEWKRSSNVKIDQMLAVKAEAR